MGLIADIVGGIFGSGKDAAEDAAAAQSAALQNATQYNRALAPFANYGRRKIRSASRQLGGLERDSLRLDRDSAKLSRFINSPGQQKSFITDNPFFAALAKDAQDKLFNNSAARGKVGSGGTAEALQNSILLLGADLVNQHVGQRISALGAERGAYGARSDSAARAMGAVNTGYNATTGSVNNLIDLATQRGNVEAGGIVGAHNAQTGALQNVIDTGVSLYGLNQLGLG